MVADRVGIWCTKRMLNTCVRSEDPRRMENWADFRVWKRKEDVHDPGKLSGFILLRYDEDTGKNTTTRVADHKERYWRRKSVKNCREREKGYFPLASN